LTVLRPVRVEHKLAPEGVRIPAQQLTTVRGKETAGAKRGAEQW
jgi:hypothetical protein